MNIDNVKKKKKKIIKISVVIILGLFIINYFHLFQGKVYSNTGNSQCIETVFISYDELYDFLKDSYWHSDEILEKYDEKFFEKSNLAFISTTTTSSGGFMMYKSAIIFGDTVKISYRYFDSMDCAIGEFYIVLKVPKRVVKVEMM